MFIRAYLRASTKEQDAKRAKNELIQFATDHGHKLAAFYVENGSGAKLVHPKLIAIITPVRDKPHCNSLILFTMWLPVPAEACF